MTDPRDDEALEIAQLADSDQLDWHVRLWAARAHAPSIGGTAGELVRSVLFGYDQALTAEAQGNATPNELVRWEDPVSAVVSLSEALRAGEQP